jgi:hypothetical protein
MSYDIEKFVGEGRVLGERQQLGAVGSAIERRNEGRHVMKLQQVRREAELVVAGEAKQLIETVARIERLARATTEAKFKVHRAKKESQILAEEDLELTAKFNALDDDLFNRLRIEIWQD